MQKFMIAMAISAIFFSSSAMSDPTPKKKNTTETPKKSTAAATPTEKNDTYPYQTVYRLVADICTSAASTDGGREDCVARGNSLVRQKTEFFAIVLNICESYSPRSGSERRQNCYENASRYFNGTSPHIRRCQGYENHVVAANCMRAIFNTDKSIAELRSNDDPNNETARVYNNRATKSVAPEKIEQPGMKKIELKSGDST